MFKVIDTRTLLQQILKLTVTVSAVRSITNYISFI